MKKYLFTFLILLFFSCQKELTPERLLDYAIAYHDPNNNWNSFNSSFHITMESPNSPNRESDITISNSENSFYVKSVTDSITIEYTIKDESCDIAFNGNLKFADSIAEKYRLNCERGKLFKNYYSYLYGLPMKLKDPGTQLKSIDYKSFKGKEYIVLNVHYDEAVGTDIWNFYFDPETYAMEVYQFFHDESKNDGEYILLTDEEIIDNIKMPKNRAWYTNKEDKLLGTDILK